MRSVLGGHPEYGNGHGKSAREGRRRGGSRLPVRAGLSLLALAAGAAEGMGQQGTTGGWSVVPDRLLVIDADGSTSRCGWFVTLDDRLVALRSTSASPVPERRDHPFPGVVRAVVEASPNHQPLPMPGLLVTADGQRLPGEPRISSGRLLWRNRWTGEVAIPLEDLAALRFAPEGEIPDAKDGDVVELTNGDRIGGLIGSIGIDVTIEQGDAAPPGATEREAVRIPLERVRSVRLLPAPIEPKGPRVWFADGTVASGRIVADEQSGGMRFIPTLPASSRSEELERDSIRLRPEDVRAYLPDVARMIPLASLPTAEIRATGTWPSYAPPEFAVSRTPGPGDAADLVLHGPGAVRWTVPKGPWMLVAEARTDSPDPAWTSFDLVVRDGAREILRRSFSADSDPVDLEVPLEGESLVIELTEGDRGPIADAIRLRRAMLLSR